MELLSQILHGRSERCIIDGQDARDEAMIVGTELGFLSLAAMLIQFVIASRATTPTEFDCFKDEVAGEDVIATNEIKKLLREESEIYIIAACLVGDNSALERMAATLRARNRSL